MAKPYQITFLKSGEKDLLDVLRHIEKTHSHASAVTVHERILEAFTKLEKMPTAYAEHSKFKSKSDFIYRRIEAGKYIVG